MNKNQRPTNFTPLVCLLDHAPPPYIKQTVE